MTTTQSEEAQVETRLAVLESQMVGVQEGQRQILAKLDSLNLRIDALHTRFDRLFYTILALGVAGIGTMIALERIF